MTTSATTPSIASPPPAVKGWAFCACTACRDLPPTAPNLPEGLGSDFDHSLHLLYCLRLSLAEPISLALQRHHDRFVDTVISYYDALEPIDGAEWSVREVEW